MESGDPDYPFNMFDSKINELLNKYVPLKKLKKKDFKNQLKPWITTGILKSVKRRDRLLHKYIKEKDLKIKENLHNEYRKLRNQIVTLISGLVKKITFKNTLLIMQVTLERHGRE